MLQGDGGGVGRGGKEAPVLGAAVISCSRCHVFAGAHDVAYAPDRPSGFELDATFCSRNSACRRARIGRVMWLRAASVARIWSAMPRKAAGQEKIGKYAE